MRGIILAAGEGARLRPLTATRPKPMLKVANKPVLEYVVESLVAAGVADLTLVVGYHREKIQSHFEDGAALGARIQYVSQDAPLGTAHALSLVDFTDDVLVLGGDNVVSPELVRGLLASSARCALAAARSDRPSQYGVVRAEGPKVLEIVEKPRAAEGIQAVNTGVYRLPGEFAQHLKRAVRKEGVAGLPDVLGQWIRQGNELQAVFPDGEWLDAVYPWDLLALTQRLQRDTSIPKTARIARTAEVTGPAAVGDNVAIDGCSVLLPTSTVGDNVTIGPGCVVENSILYDDVTLGPGCILQDTIVGPGTRLGPRVTCLKGPCAVRSSDGFHELDAFGAVIGEDVDVGGAVTLLPGTVVGNGARIAIGVKTGGSIPDNAIVVG